MPILGACVVVAAVVAGSVAVYYERRSRRRLFRGRPRLSDEEIYAQFYHSSGIPKGKILPAWHDIAQCLSVDPGLLRPTDRLSWLNTGVGLPQTDIDDLDVMIRFASRQSRILPGELQTIDDVVRYLNGARAGREMGTGA